jgi:hypothetical protein
MCSIGASTRAGFVLADWVLRARATIAFGGYLGVVMPNLEPPIRVFLSDGSWRVDYGSYIDSFHTTRAEAIATAKVASGREHRDLVIEAA